MAPETGSEKIYRSKRDNWLVVVLAAAALFAISAAISTIPKEPGSGIALLALLLAVGALVAWTYVSTFYVVTETQLLVRSGPFRWSIPLSDIQQVRPTWNPLSSPALSLDRLGIYRARGYLMISPEDKRAFLEDLAARSPGLVLDGDGAVRRGA
jgi:hypothetical protein